MLKLEFLLLKFVAHFYCIAICRVVVIFLGL